MKTKICPGPPEHEFEIPSGRGRPPTYCSEHKPVKIPTASKSSVTDVTGVTDQDEAPVNPFIAKAKKQAVNVRLAKARATKQEKAQERAQHDTEAIEKEYMLIDERIERADRDYTEAFGKAKVIGEGNGVAFLDIETDFNKAWSQSDTKMNTLMNLLRRKQYLEKIVEELTNPDAPKREPVTIPANDAGTYTDPGSKWNIEADMLDNQDEDESFTFQDALQYPSEIEDSDSTNYVDDDDVVEQFASILREFEE